MTPAFHYVVKAKLIRFIKNSEIDFIEFNEIFEDNNPIEAREQAYKHYQNFIDVLLEGKGEEYYSDKEAREHLTTFINPGTTTKIQVGDKEYEFSDSYGNGIGVYLVIDIPIQEKKLGDDKVGDEYLIHGIGNIDRGDPQGLMDGLNQEFWYYCNLSA